MVAPHAPAARDSEADRSMDSYDACDYADQVLLPDSPDSPGGINDENLEILAAVLTCIPECIYEADFARMGNPLPYIEPVHVETRTLW